jgi:hypothetical protein
VEVRQEGDDNSMRIDRLDHLVLTVADLDTTTTFYRGNLIELSNYS